MSIVGLIPSGRLDQQCSLRRGDQSRGTGRSLFFTIISAIFEAVGLRPRA